MKNVAFLLFLATLTFAAVASELTATAFDVGGYRVNLLPSPSYISPTVSFAGRSFVFAYRTDGNLGEGTGKPFAYHSFTTNRFSLLDRAEKTIRADYVHMLFIENDGKKEQIGICTNSLSFSEDGISVSATMYPLYPGRFRFPWSQKASQVIVFNGYSQNWVGTTLELIVTDELAYMNELPSHDKFDPKSWGMGGNDTKPAREMIFARVPDVISFKGNGDTRFSVNRYPGGFEAYACIINDDVMHKPFWNGPVTFSYQITFNR